jgi:hypothetical protein
MERNLLADISIDNIIRELNKHFYEQPEVARVAINQERFTIADLRDSKTIRIYTIYILCFSRALGSESTFQNLLNV